MKKKLLVLIILISSVMSGLFADVAWTPSLSGGLGLNSVNYYNGNYGGIKGFRPAFEVSAEVNPISLRIDDHYLSVPLTYEYIGETEEIGSTMVNVRQNFMASLEYGYRFTDYFRLYASGDIILRWFNKEHNAVVNYGGRITPAFNLTDYFMIEIPVSLHGGKDELTLDTRVMFTFMLDI